MVLKGTNGHAREGGFSLRRSLCDGTNYHNVSIKNEMVRIMSNRVGAVGRVPPPTNEGSETHHVVHAVEGTVEQGYAQVVEIEGEGGTGMCLELFPECGGTVEVVHDNHCLLLGEVKELMGG